MKTMLERFESKFVKSKGCWEWQAAINNGYGWFAAKKPTRAHRVAWQLYKGAIPEGMCVLHKCDNKKCVRPSHLFLGSQLDNIEDMRTKGRAGCKGYRRGRLTWQQVCEIRKSQETQRILAQKYKMNQPDISSIKQMKTYKTQKTCKSI